MSFPTVVDSSLLAEFRACQRKAQLTYFDHWKVESVHLNAGKAYATGLEAARRAFYIDGDHPDDAIAKGLGALWKEWGDYQAPEDSLKSVHRMAGALEYYFHEWPLGADGAPPHKWGDNDKIHGIEFSFIEPLPIRHPETGDPILFSGRADMVVDAFGGVFIEDDKTTSALGPSWPKMWDMRSQFTAYCWGLRAHGIQPTGVLVRGLAILKNDYKAAQAVTYRAGWEVDRWLAQTVHDVETMIEAWANDRWSWNLDHTCTAFHTPCPFTRVCKSPDPEKWLSIYFRRSKWDPVTRTETEILPETAS